MRLPVGILPRWYRLLRCTRNDGAKRRIAITFEVIHCNEGTWLDSIHKGSLISAEHYYAQKQDYY